MQECFETAESASLPAKIAAGFESTRTLENTKLKYQELLQHPTVVQKGLPLMNIPSQVRFGIAGEMMGRGKFDFLKTRLKFI